MAISYPLVKITENTPFDPVSVVVVIWLASPPSPGRLLTLVELGAVKVMRVAVFLVEPWIVTQTVLSEPL